MLERFWRLVDDSAGPDECWPWTAYIQGNGYGRFTVRGGLRLLTHRLAYELATGEEIPAGAEAAHSCHLRSCCNPSHIRLSTHAENMADMRAHWKAGDVYACPHCLRSSKLPRKGNGLVASPGDRR